MAKRTRTLALLAVLALALGSASWLRHQQPRQAVQLTPVSLPSTPPPPSKPARPAEAPDHKWLDLARQHMTTGSRQARCGPYLLITDVRDAGLLQGCDRLATQLDKVYEQRFGVRSVSQAAEAILLFAEQRAFRAFVASDAWTSGVHAGYASPGRGFMALYAGEQSRREILTTLAHELTHLVHRRALGSNLPPWLSEGLADAIGDTASEDGFRPVDRSPGSGPQARRLRDAYGAGQVPSLERLAGLDRTAYDRGVVSFDYEQSALLVRFLLVQPDQAPHFRAFLGRLAEGEPYRPELLRETLGVSWPELERAFVSWL